MCATASAAGPPLPAGTAAGSRRAARGRRRTVASPLTPRRRTHGSVSWHGCPLSFSSSSARSRRPYRVATILTDANRLLRGRALVSGRRGRHVSSTEGMSSRSDAGGGRGRRARAVPPPGHFTAPVQCAARLAHSDMQPPTNRRRSRNRRRRHPARRGRRLRATHRRTPTAAAPAAARHPSRRSRAPSGGSQPAAARLHAARVRCCCCSHHRVRASLATRKNNSRPPHSSLLLLLRCLPPVLSPPPPPPAKGAGLLLGSLETVCLETTLKQTHIDRARYYDSLCMLHCMRAAGGHGTGGHARPVLVMPRPAAQPGLCRPCRPWKKGCYSTLSHPPEGWWRQAAVTVTLKWRRLPDVMRPVSPKCLLPVL